LESSTPSSRRQKRERERELKAAEDKGKLEFSFLEKRAARKRRRGG
jgi:hypothetical protein